MVKELEELCAAKFVANFCCKPKIKEKFLTINYESERYKKKFQRSVCYFEENMLIEKDIYETLDIEFEGDVFNLIKILEKEFQDEINTLPYPLRRVIPKHLLNFIVIEIVKWVKYQCEFYFMNPWYYLNILTSLYITHNGLLDRDLIARYMVQDKSLDVLIRIVIAIDCILIDDIRVLWTESKRKKLSQRKFIKDFILPDTDDKKKMWKSTLHLAIENDENDANLSSVCLLAVSTCNEVAFKNCWKMLNLSGKETVLKKSLVSYLPSLLLDQNAEPDEEFVNFTLNTSFMEIFRFLIYNGDEEMVKILFQVYMRKVHFLALKSFLFWPYQDIFLKVLNLVWGKITPLQFYELIHSIVDMIEDDEISKTYNYRLLLIKVLRLAPSDYRKYVSSTELERTYPMYTAPKYTTFQLGEQNFVHYYKRTYVISMFTLLSRYSLNRTITDDDAIFVKEIASYVSAKGKKEIVSKILDDLCEDALSVGNLRLADLFVESFVEKDSISEYKQRFFFTQRGKYILALHIEELNDEFTKNWASK